jgi:hypothetical protein
VTTEREDGALIHLRTTRLFGDSIVTATIQAPLLVGGAVDRHDAGC